MKRGKEERGKERKKEKGEKRRERGEGGEINCDRLEKFHYYVASCSVDTTCVHRQEPKLWRGKEKEEKECLYLA